MHLQSECYCTCMLCTLFLQARGGVKPHLLLRPGVRGAARQHSRALMCVKLSAGGCLARCKPLHAACMLSVPCAGVRRRRVHTWAGRRVLLQLCVSCFVGEGWELLDRLCGLTRLSAAAAEWPAAACIKAAPANTRQPTPPSTQRPAVVRAAAAGWGRRALGAPPAHRRRQQAALCGRGRGCRPQ